MIKKVAVFNDLSGFGKCSLTAAIPVLSALGVTPHPVPTAVLTGQGGYPVFYSQDLTGMLSLYTKAWKANGAKFDAIYSGYLTGPKQIDCVLEFIDEFKEKNTFILIDPVMGDNGRVYSIYSSDLLENMRTLTSKANLITPNITEACLLAGEDYEKITQIKDSNETLNQVISIGERLKSNAIVDQDVVITGVKTYMENKPYIYNIAITKQGVVKSGQKLFDKSFSGTGDVFASAMCGLRLNGYSTIDGINIATDFLYKSIADAMADGVEGNEGIYFERHLKDMTKVRYNYERESK